MFNIDCSSRISSKIVARVIFSFENEFSHQIPIQNRTNFVVTKMRFKNCVVPLSVSIIPLIRAQSTIQVDYKLPHSAPVLFTEFINNPVLEFSIRNHGCWCAKLDPAADQSVLGGPDVVDDLDTICKHWAHARRCSKVAGRCDGLMMAGSSYEIEYTTGLVDARCPDADTCLSEVCQIDLAFVDQVLSYLMANPGVSIPVTPVCTPVHSKGQASPNCDLFEMTPYEAFTTQPDPLMDICNDTPMDLVFVVDGSGSVGQSNFDKQIEFAKRVTEYMTISPIDTRIGMVQYSDEPQLEFEFVDANVALTSSFDSVVYRQGGTNTGKAIDFAYNNIIQNGARSGVRVTQVVLTDGFSFDDVATPSDLMRTHGIDMFGVGYFGANTIQLNAIANDPDDDFVYQAATIDELLAITEQLVQVICSQPASYTG